MTKLTKIVATIGPSSNSDEMIKQLISSGVDVFRFNLKHNSIDWHAKYIGKVNQIAKQSGRTVGILIDLQGPELRIKMPCSEIEVNEGEKILVSKNGGNQKEKSLSISYPEVTGSLKQGQKVFADDGRLEFRVVIEGDKYYFQSLGEGVLENRKSLNIPNVDLSLPALVENDIEGLKLLTNHEIDFAALSYVRSVKDILILKQAMRSLKVKAKIISKIETPNALDKLDAIIEESDGIMVARGDLGVELAIEQVPFFQKKIIKSCIEKGKPVITATEMLHTMINSPKPTRAEVSDVANAIYDYSDALMLSGETASGNYPLQAVSIMRKTIEFTERQQSMDTRDIFDLSTNEQEGLIANAAYDLFLKIKKMRQRLRGFIVFTQTGKTARFLSRFRPTLPIYAFCPTKEVARELSLRFGVQPLLENYENRKGTKFSSSNLRDGIRYLLKSGQVRRGDRLILLRAVKWSDEDNTSTLQLVTCTK